MNAGVQEPLVSLCHLPRILEHCRADCASLNMEDEPQEFSAVPPGVEIFKIGCGCWEASPALGQKSDGAEGLGLEAE